jgi:hypothetical protein
MISDTMGTTKELVCVYFIHIPRIALFIENIHLYIRRSEERNMREKDYGNKKSDGDKTSHDTRSKNRKITTTHWMRRKGNERSNTTHTMHFSWSVKHLPLLRNGHI